MVEIIGDIRDYLGFYPVCVTTNGYITKNNVVPMGAGVAKDILQEFPTINKTLADKIKLNGNITQIILDDPLIIAFPTKPSVVSTTDESKILPRYLPNARNSHTKYLPGFMAKSDPGLIEESLGQLIEMVERECWNRIVVPWPGIGNGGLTVFRVRQIIQNLDDRFLFIRRSRRLT